MTLSKSDSRVPSSMGIFFWNVFWLKDLRLVSINISHAGSRKKKQYEATIHVLFAFKNLYRPLPQDGHRFRVTRMSHSKLRGVYNNRSYTIYLIQCPIYAQTLVAKNGLHKIQFRLESFKKNYQKISFSTTLTRLICITWEVPYRTRGYNHIAAPEATQPLYCNAHYRTFMCLHKLSPTLES